jgi:hypothetical protein
MDTSDLLHLSIPCPACSEPVHVVASVFDGRSQWCCVPCQVVGTLPLDIDRESVRSTHFRPVASA